LASLKRHPKRLHFVFHDIWCIKSFFSSKYMYFSSLLTLLPFCHLDVDYVREFHRSFGLVHRAGWLPPLAGLAAAVAGCLPAAAGWAALAGWLAGQLPWLAGWLPPPAGQPWLAGWTVPWLAPAPWLDMPYMKCTCSYIVKINKQ
jgi:hypothetical protein